MQASEWVQFRFGSKLLTDEWAVECEIADSSAWAVECPPYRGGGTSPGDNFDCKTSSGDNFVTPPILVRGHQTAEGEFSLGENFVTPPTLGSLWTISCVQLWQVQILALPTQQRPKKEQDPGSTPPPPPRPNRRRNPNKSADQCFSKTGSQCPGSQSQTPNTPSFWLLCSWSRVETQNISQFSKKISSLGLYMVPEQYHGSVRWWSTGICPGLQILWRWLNSRTDFFLHFLSLVLMRKLGRLFGLRQSVRTQRFCAHLLTI